MKTTEKTFKPNNNGLIKKATTEENYTIVPNTILQFKTLTFDASGLLAYLLSMPKDWSIVKTKLYKQIGISEGRTDKAWSELVDKKYISVEKHSSKGGWFYTYYVQSTPFNETKEEVYTEKPIVTEELIEELVNTINETDKKEYKFNEDLSQLDNFKLYLESENLPIILIDMFTGKITKTELWYKNEEKYFKLKKIFKEQYVIIELNSMLSNHKFIFSALDEINQYFSLSDIEYIISNLKSVKSKFKKELIESNLLRILTCKQKNIDYEFVNN